MPKGINDSIFLPQRYPVVYLLDGDRNFSSVVGMLQQQSFRGVYPEMIVVGIPNTNRTRDLTPTKDTTNNDPLPDYGGGGEAFMSFIEKELMPYIDSSYPTQPYKMLIGHSLGGLTVMNTLINHSQLFNSYICIDPSLWWDNQNLLKTSKQILQQKNFAKKTLYMGIANTMEKGMNVVDVVNDTMNSTLHIRSILEMDKYIKNQKPKELNYASKYYNDDTHGSVPLITEYDALRFIFKQYPLIIFPKENNDSTFDIANIIASHFKKISDEFGYKVMMPENKINAEAYRLLRLKHYKKAEGCFKLYIDSYPTSFNAYNAYGDYFVAIGDKKKAIENFKTALTIREHSETRKKLNKLVD